MPEQKVTPSKRLALIVGINDYPGTNALQGCHADAEGIAKLLYQHADQSDNYVCDLVTSDKFQVTRMFLRKKLYELLNPKNPEEIQSVVFYFSGHGSRNLFGGYLATQDAKEWDIGIPFHEVMYLANNSKIAEINIIIDACHSGGMGDFGGFDPGTTIPVSALRAGVSVLTASAKDQLSIEQGTKGGIFTQHVRAALEGAAADILGNVNLASTYSHVAAIMARSAQDPLFKTNAVGFNPIRKAKPKISLEILREITRLFTVPDQKLLLDPGYEHDKSSLPPEDCSIDKAKEADFTKLQKLRDVGLVIPSTPHAHMYYAAIKRGACELTPLGEHYWNLVNQNLI